MDVMCDVLFSILPGTYLTCEEDTKSVPNNSKCIFNGLLTDW